MNNKHTFKINQYPVPKWLDPIITTTPVPPFWNIAHYVNGEFRQSFGPYNNKCEAEQVVNCLSAYFNRRDMACTH
jgi:hypothetical protein